MKVLEVLGYDINDIDDLVQLSHSLFRYLMIIAAILAAVVMWSALTKSGSLPPEPQWWLDLEKMVGITW